MKYKASDIKLSLFIQLSRHIFERSSDTSFMKIHRVGAELFHADRETDREIRRTDRQTWRS